MDEEKPSGYTETDPYSYGTPDQRREIERWENAGWLFLHWIESPLPVAALENGAGDVVFIDDKGFAWKGANFSKADPVPLKQYPPWGLDEWVVP